jgi:hypothetical protein
MESIARDYRQCTRCREWKHISNFRDDMALPESRHVCQDCFAKWLAEQWALDQQQPRQV